jgi:hypothetical protein
MVDEFSGLAVAAADALVAMWPGVISVGCGNAGSGTCGTNLLGNV